MEQEKILNLILDKLESIDKEQKLTNARLDSIEIRLDSIEIRLDSIEVRLDSVEARLDTIEAGLDEVENRLEENSVDIKEIKSIHGTVKDFILSTETAIEVYEKDHNLIEKLKKVAEECS